MRIEGWVTPQEAAERLGVSRSTLYSYVRRGFVEARVPRGNSRGMLVSEESLKRIAETALVRI